MEILLQMKRQQETVTAVMRPHNDQSEQVIRGLFEVLQQMAHVRQVNDKGFMVNDYFMINLMRLILYSAYHVNYFDANGQILDDHDIYLDVPLEHDYAQRNVDYDHISVGLDNIFDALLQDAEIDSTEQMDGSIISQILVTIAAMEPTKDSLPTLKLALVPKTNLLNDVEE